MIAMFKRRRPGLRRIARGVVCLILPGSAAVAQDTHRVTGTVVDPTGGAVAGAKVTLIDSSGATSREVLTDDAGGFSIVAATGTCTIKVDKEHFEPAAEYFHCAYLRPTSRYANQPKIENTNASAETIKR